MENRVSLDGLSIERRNLDDLFLKMTGGTLDLDERAGRE